MAEETYLSVSHVELELSVILLPVLIRIFKDKIYLGSLIHGKVNLLWVKAR